MRLDVNIVRLISLPKPFREFTYPVRDLLAEFLPKCRQNSIAWLLKDILNANIPPSAIRVVKSPLSATSACYMRFTSLPN